MYVRDNWGHEKWTSFNWHKKIFASKSNAMPHKNKKIFHKKILTGKLPGTQNDKYTLFSIFGENSNLITQ